MKVFDRHIADAYHPAEVEATWDSWWQSKGFYRPDNNNNDNHNNSENFVMMMPMPNITGHLHLGHALMCSIQDAIVRWHRMSGKNVLWLPGTDHAGIATQVVVEKKLMREEGKTRHDLGREEFIRRIWQWKEKYGNRITTQIRRLGASVDWSREVFTMDNNLSVAVEEAFIQLYNKKLIYRSNRLVNWSCALRTAISSIEVKDLELQHPTLLKVPGYEKPVEFGVLHSFAYPLFDDDDNDNDNDNAELIVTTTRIETMLGDAAVAVHPDDERYKKFHGKRLRHPFIPDRQMIVVTDSELVDMSFATGAVKVTPAHDSNDFRCGEKHNLPKINIFTDDGLINDNGGVKYKGMKRFDAREQIIVDLTTLGLYRGKTNNKMTIGLCSRSNDIIEPVLRPQWYVACGDMAAAAVQVVKQGELKIIPEAHTTIWYNWLENVQDWCISRQLWWGHRVPAYFVRLDDESENNNNDNQWIVAHNMEEARTLAQARFPERKIISIEQDPDVLDTWFSSGLFPFSAMGWPKQTPDLSRYYPGTLLETGHDILFFWVARMVMLGLELTGTLPFTTVLLHPLLRDKYGRKMAKTLGNVVDPIDVIEGISLEELQLKLQTGNLDPAELTKAAEGQRDDFPDGIAECGTDALRFGLLAYTSQCHNINLDIKRIVAYRQFGNKLWQATRFALLKFDDDEKKFQKPLSLHTLFEDVKVYGSISDQWILHRLHVAVEKVDIAFDNYAFSDVTTALYNFWLYDLCDNYLELIKPLLRSSSSSSSSECSQIVKAKHTTTLAVLYTCLDIGLRLLHPVMPFITEELYHHVHLHLHLPGGGMQKYDSLVIAPYPKPTNTSFFINHNAQRILTLIQDIAHSARSTRTSLGLTKKRVDMYIICNNTTHYDDLKLYANEIRTLSIANSVQVLTSSNTVPEDCLTSMVMNNDTNVEIHIPVTDLVDDISAEVAKMEKQTNRLTESLEKLKTKMAVPGYEKSKEDVKIKHVVQLQNVTEELTKLNDSINKFKRLMTIEQVKQYENDKKRSLETEAVKYKASIAKMKSTVLTTKTLQKIQKAEGVLDTINAEIAKL